MINIDICYFCDYIVWFFVVIYMNFREDLKDLMKLFYKSFNKLIVVNIF